MASFGTVPQAQHLGTVPLPNVLGDGIDHAYVHDMINEHIDNVGDEYQPLLMQIEAEMAFGLLTPRATPNIPDLHLADEADFTPPFFEWPADFQEGPALPECPHCNRDNMQPFLLHDVGDGFDDAVNIIVADIQEAGLPDQALLLGLEEHVCIAMEHAIMGVDNCFPNLLIEGHPVPLVWWPWPVRNVQV